MTFRKSREKFQHFIQCLSCDWVILYLGVEQIYDGFPKFIKQNIVQDG